MERKGHWTTKRVLSEEFAALGFHDPTQPICAREPLSEGSRRAFERSADQIVAEIAERHGLKME